MRIVLLLDSWAFDAFGFASRLVYPTGKLSTYAYTLQMCLCESAHIGDDVVAVDIASCRPVFFQLHHAFGTKSQRQSCLWCAGRFSEDQQSRFARLLNRR